MLIEATVKIVTEQDESTVREDIIDALRCYGYDVSEITIEEL